MSLMLTVSMGKTFLSLAAMMFSLMGRMKKEVFTETTAKNVLAHEAAQKGCRNISAYDVRWKVRCLLSPPKL